MFWGQVLWSILGTILGFRGKATDTAMARCGGCWFPNGTTAKLQLSVQTPAVMMVWVFSRSRVVLHPKSQSALEIQTYCTDPLCAASYYKLQGLTCCILTCRTHGCARTVERETWFKLLDVCLTVSRALLAVHHTSLCTAVTRLCSQFSRRDSTKGTSGVHVQQSTQRHVPHDQDLLYTNVVT